VCSANPQECVGLVPRRACPASAGAWFVVGIPAHSRRYSLTLHGQATSWAFQLDTSLGGAMERRGRVPAALTECRVLRNEAQRGQSF
jgi:hypothetical protein